MLQLHTNKFRNTYSQSYWYNGTSTRLESGDHNIRLQNHYIWFRSPSPIYYADLPLHMNGITLNRYYFQYDEDREDRTEEERETLITTVRNIGNDTEENQIVFLTGYLAGTSLEDKDYTYDFIDEDQWEEYKEGSIKSLYDKCIEQTSLRESERQGRNINQHLRVFKHKSKNILLMLTDYNDTDQESETFLSLGLIPVIFENFKERFEPKEIEYFKCLVNRSQVKRISNVKPTKIYQELETLEKYFLLEREIRYKTLFDVIANSRINTVENQSRHYRDQAERAIREYDEALKKIHEYEIIINKYKEGTSEVVDELKTISKMKGVYDLINYNGNMLQIVLRVPLDYFDIDEAECAIRNIHDENVVKFINDVFIEQKYKLYIRTDAYFAYTNDARFQDFTRLDVDNCAQINALFNPHFQYFNCLGDYKPQLVKAMADQDLTLFVNIAMAAARSINFKDGAVCNRWFEWLRDCFTNNYYLDTKCLEKDGKLYTLKQWLTNNFEEETNEETVD